MATQFTSPGQSYIPQGMGRRRPGQGPGGGGYQPNANGDPNDPNNPNNPHAVAPADFSFANGGQGFNGGSPAQPQGLTPDQQTQWQKKHPRRTEVNTRLENQNDRIHQGVKNGELSKPEAKQLHKEDRHIRQEERTMAAKNGGHIT